MPKFAFGTNVRRTAPRSPDADRGTEADDSRTPPSTRDHDDEQLGLNDPFLDSLPVAPPAEDDDIAPLAPPREVELQLLVEPRDLGEKDNDGDTLDIRVDLDDCNDPSPPHIDDDTGTDFLEPLVAIDALDEADIDDPEDGPHEAPFLLEPIVGPRFEAGDNDADEPSLEPSTLYVDEGELPWAKEQWTVRPSGEAFSARRHLALVGSTLAIAGESTHLYDTKNELVLDALPIAERTVHVAALDPSARELLVLTATGRLLRVTRDLSTPSSAQQTLVTRAMITGLWQLAPGVPVVLARCEHGLLYDYADGRLRPHGPQALTTNCRLIALSGLGEPRATLWRSSTGVRLCLEASLETQRFPLPPALERAMSSASPQLLGFNESVLIGVRDHGLWLYRTKTREYLPIAGCRNFTAMTACHYGPRPVAFVGLYSELDDHAEIAMVDLATGRVQRIADLRVHSDCPGPEDDPPELARIDSLLWDGSRGLLWAAGSFGLERYAPPQLKSS